PARPARTAHLLRVALDAAERDQRPPARLRRVHPQADVLLRLHLQVKTNLLAQLPLDHLLPEDRAELLQTPPHPVHDRPPPFRLRSPRGCLRSRPPTGAGSPSPSPAQRARSASAGSTSHAGSAP